MYKRIIISSAIMLITLFGVIATGVKKDPEITTISKEALEFYLEGVEHAQNFYRKEAIQAFESAIELDREFAMAYLGLSSAYRIQGDYIKSRQLIEKAAMFEEFVTEREALIIEIERNDGEEHDQSLSDSLIQVLFDKYPNTVDSHDLKAQLAIRNLDITEAINHYEKILKIDSDFAPVYNTLGYMYARQGRYEDAIRNLKIYAEKASGQANPYDSLGEILIRVGRYEEAIESLRKALEIKPELSQEKSFLGAAINKNLGNAYFGLGQISKAIEYFDRAQALNPGENIATEAVTNKFMVLLISNNKEEFISNLDELESLKTNDNTKPYAHLIHGIYFLQTKNIDSAIKESDELTIAINTLAENNSSAMHRFRPIQGFLEAEILISQKRYSEAIDVFKTKCFISEEVKQSQWLNWRLAEAYRLEGEFEKSENLVNDYLKINPNNFLLRSVMVQAHFDKGDYKKAKNELKKLKKLLAGADSALSIISNMNNIEEALEVLL